MNYNASIVVGLAGQAGVGKTVTAEALAPTAQVVTLSCSCSHGMQDHLDDPDVWPCRECDCIRFNCEGQILWTHYFFALPIYRIVTARQKIEGKNARDRMLYEIHEGLLDLFGRNPLYSAIKHYDDFVQLVHYIASIPCEPAGEKARTFMQEFGSLCREYDDEVFVNWIRRKVNDNYRAFQQEYPDHVYPGLKSGVVLSDVRFSNEAEMIGTYPLGSLFCLTARPDVRYRRLEERDGHVLTEDQANHESEQSLTTIHPNLFTKVIDTSEFTIKDQVAYVKQLISAEYQLTHI